MQKKGYFLTNIQRIIRIHYRVKPINPTDIFSYSATETTLKKMLGKFLDFFTLLENKRNKLNFN